MNLDQFKINIRGGLIIPSGTVFEDSVKFPPYTEFGVNCRFGVKHKDVNKSLSEQKLVSDYPVFD